jgi:hypothetical protein
MTLNYNKFFKGDAYFFDKKELKSMRSLKCHSSDCVPNVFHLLGIIDKKMATFLASLFKKGIKENRVIEYLNSIHEAQYIHEYLFDIDNGNSRRVTLQESLIKLKEMEEYAKSIIRDNSALISVIKYKLTNIGHIIVIAKIEGDVYIIDPQQNKHFNISKTIRDNNYEKSLLDYIKNIIKITVFIKMPGSKHSIYKNPFSEIFIKNSLLKKENRSPPKYIPVDKLVPYTKYRIINKEDLSVQVGVFHLLEDGNAIFLIDREREEINPQEHLFLSFIVRSAPRETRSKSRTRRRST